MVSDEELKRRKAIYNKKYREENKVKISETNRKYREENKVSIAEYQKIYREENKVSNGEYQKIYQEENRERKRKVGRLYAAKHKDKKREYDRIYQRERRKIDPKYRLRKNTRTAVYTCLKEANVSKYRSTFDILGYTIEELMSHLENLFTDGMTWDNYGKWHLDHKIPMVLFEFESVEDDGFKECWKLSNLQPLWAYDNLSKGDKIL